MLASEATNPMLKPINLKVHLAIYKAAVGEGRNFVVMQFVLW